jgi:hypothetical protein
MTNDVELNRAVEEAAWAAAGTSVLENFITESG